MNGRIKKCKNKICCCKCIYHIGLYSHPCVDGKPMSNFISHICLLFMEKELNCGSSRIHLSNEHGECECFLDENKFFREIKKKVKEKDEKDVCSDDGCRNGKRCRASGGKSV